MESLRHFARHSTPALQATSFRIFQRLVQTLSLRRLRPFWFQFTPKNRSKVVNRRRKKVFQLFAKAIVPHSSWKAQMRRGKIRKFLFGKLNGKQREPKLNIREKFSVKRLFCLRFAYFLKWARGREEFAECIIFKFHRFRLLYPISTVRWTKP